jgi:AraC-like DNA-binding protein
MQTLEQILHRQLIPGAKAGAAERIIVARKRMNAAAMPPNVELTRRPLTGERTAVKSSRVYGSARRVNAVWPKAGMHEAEYARLIFVVEGQVHFQAGDYLLGCGKGDFILIPPRFPYPGDKYSPHLIASQRPGRPCILLWMLPYLRGFQCYLSHYENDRRKHYPGENWLFLNGQIVGLFHFLIEEAAGDKNNQLCDGLMLAFATALQRETAEMHYLHPGPVVEAKIIHEDGNNFAAQLETYVNQHLGQSLTTEHVARELYMSRAQFARRMRREIGQTFGEFLTAHRLQQAKNLLEQSEWTVQAIAKYAGFKSSTYFHTFFQREMGCTPGQFRLKARRSRQPPEIETIK